MCINDKNIKIDHFNNRDVVKHRLFNYVKLTERERYHKKYLILVFFDFSEKNKQRV